MARMGKTKKTVYFESHGSIREERPRKGKYPYKIKRNGEEYPWLDDRIIKQWISLMKKWGVSEVARSSRGFLTAYLSVGGDPDSLPPEWHAKRNAFIKRHMAQVNQRDEALYKNGLPTRRHLALVAWAYSPDSDFEDKNAP